MMYRKDIRPKWKRRFAWWPVKLWFYKERHSLDDPKIPNLSIGWRPGTRVVWCRCVEYIVHLPNWESASGSYFHRLIRKNRPENQK